MKTDKIHDDDQQLARVLRLAAPRPSAPPELEAAVRVRVRKEWLHATTRRRRTSWLAAAAIAGLAAGLTFWMARPSIDTDGSPVATLVRATGEVRHERSGDGRGWLTLDEANVTAGDRLATTSSGRAALRLANGTTVRLDHSTELVIGAIDQLTLTSGRVYVDTHAPGATGGPLKIRTSRGIVSDVGTQFEVAYVESAVRVRVREGAVTVDRDTGLLQGDRGDELRIEADGSVERALVPTFGAHWSWVESIAPSFDIDGRPLIEFLAWIARETGHELVFANRVSEQAARSTVLHGSVQGFSPDKALVAVLATTRLRPVVEDGVILVDLRVPDPGS
ncbi:hypothetical protein BH24PSE2_BH24PSE2_15410 [soil metagenome]